MRKKQQQKTDEKWYQQNHQQAEHPDTWKWKKNKLRFKYKNYTQQLHDDKDNENQWKPNTKQNRQTKYIHALIITINVAAPKKRDEKMMMKLAVRDDDEKVTNVQEEERNRNIYEIYENC